MFIFRILNVALTLYALALLFHFVLPYLVSAQQSWMAVLSRICEPGIRIGNYAAARLLKNRRFKADIGAPVAAILCWVLKVLLGLFL